MRRWSCHLALAAWTSAVVGCGQAEPQRRCDPTPPAASNAPCPVTLPVAPLDPDARPRDARSHDAICAAAIQRGFAERAEPFDVASVVGLQDIPAGGTWDGSSLLVQRGLCSVNLSALVVDEIPRGSGLYRQKALAPIPGIDLTHEEGVTMESDGLTIIAMTADGLGFRAARRSGVGKVDFAPVADDPFSSIVVTGSQTLWAPAISADGLAFYYTVVHDPDPGIYESLRPTTGVLFPRGTRMPALVQDLAQYVNGVSADHLTLFLELKEGFGAFVLSRASQSEPFQNLNAPDPPTRAPGLRTRPLGSCNRLIGTCSPPGGCRGEDVCIWVN